MDSSPQPVDPPWHITANGQWRERFESQRAPGFGLAGEADEDHLLNRVALAIEANTRDLAMVVELASGSVVGGRQLPPTQRNVVDVVQGYGEAALARGSQILRLRLGRQPMSLGSSRLVSVRDSTNIRRAFDGLRMTWQQDARQLDAFLLKPVLARPGVLDDAAARTQSLRGLYLTLPSAAPSAGALEVYYLGFRQSTAQFGDQRGTERRHSLGLRWAGSASRLHWDVEAVGQSGRYAQRAIRAWTASFDVSYALSAAPAAPRAGLKLDLISGDHERRGRLGTFNPLFPRLSYFSEANLAAPANLVDVQPSVSATLASHLRITAGWNALWRYSRRDDFYLPPLRAVPLPSDAGRYLGQQWISTLEWRWNARLTAALSAVRFEPGAALREAGGRKGHFVSASIQREL